MLSLLTPIASYIFPTGRALKLAKQAINITNSTNPVILSKNVTLTVLECCTPPLIKLTVHCIAAASLLDASLSVPNPITVSSTLHMISEIYEHC